MDSAVSKNFWKRRQLAAPVIIAAALVLFGWLVYTPAGLLGKADAVGYAVCHRIDLRSFHLGIRQISLCARCTGMYLGAVSGLLFLWLRAPFHGNQNPRRVNMILGLLFLLFAADGLNSFSNLIPALPSLYTTTNSIRIFTGTGFGLVMAALVYPAFNQTAWRAYIPKPAIAGLRELAGLLAVGITIAMIILSENPFILYPASLISAAGVVLLLTLVYSMMVMLLLKRENFADQLRDLAVPLLIGLTIGMLQIAAADLLRFWLTGTWEGFHFG